MKTMPKIVTQQCPTCCCLIISINAM